MASAAGKQENRNSFTSGAAKVGAIGSAKSLSRGLQSSNIMMNCITTAIFRESTPEYIVEKKS